eukprot:CAMPEP_0115092424 /NCGR_PEP_ID=MMETSP0227-20121206/26756_1 /TAXON_ID=89957 /ORGANISM="Polarella glacialis, Strain CCMP 1383" /LENGTH=72 /DNA_ID=CAMNT_0002484237 /DNA_START=86 /DNA_END=301 /DNA_ORIENTATION=-
MMAVTRFSRTKTWTAGFMLDGLLKHEGLHVLVQSHDGLLLPLMPAQPAQCLGASIAWWHQQPRSNAKDRMAS